MLGIEPAIAHEPAFAEFFSGNTTREWPADALPYASVYSGHQFGVWAGQLGDGRALGSAKSSTTARASSCNSRARDARPIRAWATAARCCARRSANILCSEAMHHLGIPTTRALCVIGSDQPVRREEVETAAVVTRVAPSFVRFGHFEHFYSNDRVDALQRARRPRHRALLSAVPEADDPYLALLNEAVPSHRRSASRNGRRSASATA